MGSESSRFISAKFGGGGKVSVVNKQGDYAGTANLNTKNMKKIGLTRIQKQEADRLKLGKVVTAYRGHKTTKIELEMSEFPYTWDHESSKWVKEEQQ